MKQPDVTVASLLAGTRLDRLERRLLLSAATGLSREDMARCPEALLDAETLARYEILLTRREVGEPVAYLVGKREFYGREFAVDARVLIPRPETELVVDLALLALKDRDTPSILDLGTGSGCLAVTLALERPDARVVALDVSSGALEVAGSNATRLGASIEFLRADLCQTDQALQLFGASRRLDVIVANPPYIAENDVHLSQGDLRFEPKFALTDGHDGFQLINACIELARHVLGDEGCFLIEHGHDQAKTVRDKLAAAGFLAAQSWPDLAGIERVSGAFRGASRVLVND